MNVKSAPGTGLPVSMLITALTTGPLSDGLNFCHWMNVNLWRTCRAQWLIKTVSGAELTELLCGGGGGGKK
jgi:hypothetical protein